ncbi:MAG: NAD(P)/FAD-dependent oxidoreductase [Longimicrobiales bacterium]
MSAADGPVVVVGAGAAGLMAAIFAATADRQVLLLERTKDGGRKIIISGGGRCNVLPSTLSPTQFVTESSPNTLRNMLLSWPLPLQQRFFERDLGVPLALEKSSGKLFPVSNRARDVRDALIGEARRRGAEVRFDCTVQDIVPAGLHRWNVELSGGTTIEAASVIVATGGLSVPATGSDGAGLRILERLGHTVHDTYPALTPLTCEPPRHAALAGVSLNLRLTAPLMKGRFEADGGFLFTHRGYSGPAVLNISHLAVRSKGSGVRPQPILVQWTDMDTDAWDAALREGGAGQVGPLVRRHLPARLAEVLVEESGVDAERTLAELRREERARLVTTLARYPLPWTGDEGYRKAEVTGGGVALSELDPRTLESRRQHGLFVCGEALDAFGPIGGYNFAWAWATGRAAGLGAVRVDLDSIDE